MDDEERGRRPRDAEAEAERAQEDERGDRGERVMRDRERASAARPPPTARRGGSRQAHARVANESFGVVRRDGVEAEWTKRLEVLGPIDDVGREE